MTGSELGNFKSSLFEGFRREEVPAGVDFISGKVRDIFDKGDELVIVTTDRISAFDRILGTIVCKGEVLNRLSLHWFRETEDIVPNHIKAELTPRSVAVHKCEVLPVEVIVRGYITGSAWRDYQKGAAVSGIEFPAGLRFNQKLDTPLITPSTKAEQGEHDLPISGEEIVAQGLVEKELWREVEATALKLFERGTRLAAERGLILVDTKYEFGLLDGKLVLVDEVHTPDSSRYWFADTYRELFESGEPQRKIDKEYLRQWLMERGFMGDGDVPPIPEEIRLEVAARYVRAYEQVTGRSFAPESPEPEREKRAVLAYLDK